jgi:hypothetical protein
MAIHVQTIAAQGGDVDKLDQELSLKLSAYENARDWRLILVETIDSGTYETGGQQGRKAVVRAYYREGK